MRLIDADRLINEFHRETVEREGSNLWHISGIMAFIENEPTAFNVEAVVKELEELKQIEINDECPMECICGNCECSSYKCKGCYTSRAIEIVRKGGVK